MRGRWGESAAWPVPLGIYFGARCCKGRLKQLRSNGVHSTISSLQIERGATFRTFPELRAEVSFCARDSQDVAAFIHGAQRTNAEGSHSCLLLLDWRASSFGPGPSEPAATFSGETIGGILAYLREMAIRRTLSQGQRFLAFMSLGCYLDLHNRRGTGQGIGATDGLWPWDRLYPSTRYSGIGQRVWDAESGVA